MRGARGFACAQRASVTALLTAAFLACASTPPAPALPPPAPPRVGLALGGGGARGFAEIGVLRVLEQEKIPIYAVAGTSVGSLVGALYADSGHVLDAEFLAVTIEREDLFDYGVLPIFSGGFVKGERLEAFLRDHLKHTTIESMPVRFAAVATDIRSGKTVVFTRGPIAPAVHASCAIPGVFVPVTIGGVTYVDGGVTDPVPVAAARALGAERVIAVSISPAPPSTLPDNPIDVAYQSVTLLSAELARLRASEADLTLTPDVGSIGYDDFSQKKKLIEAGETAARAALPEIRRLLEAPASAPSAALP
jgi:NTE family protein